MEAVDMSREKERHSRIFATNRTTYKEAVLDLVGAKKR